MAWWNFWRGGAGKTQAARGYDAGSHGGRNKGRTPRDEGPHSVVARALPLLRAAARELARNDPHASKGVAVLTRHLVGTGIRPRPRTGDRKVDRQILDLWKRWGEQCHVEHDLDVYGLQHLTVRGIVESGEGLIRRRIRRMTDGLAVPMQLQVLEGDQLDGGRDAQLSDGGTILGGVEFDPLGRRRAYHLHRVHPLEGTVLTGTGSVRVDASEVAHAFRMYRPGQVRGATWLHSVALQLRDIGDFRGAEIVRKKTESAFVGIVSDDRDDAEPAIVGDKELEAGADETKDGSGYVHDKNGNVVERVIPGMFLYLPDGRKITFSNPSAIGGYREYVETELRAVAAGMGVPYEFLTGDLSRVNFSSARVGLNDFRADIEALQTLFVVPLICRPMWRWFCEMARLAGVMPAGAGEGVVPVEWAMPSWSSVNPLQDAQARLLSLRTGTTSLTEEVAREGWDFEDLVEEIAAERELLAKHNLAFEGDPQTFQKSGAVQAATDVDTQVLDEPSGTGAA